MSTHFVNQSLKPITLETADAVQAEILQTAKKQVGFIPNMYANMVNFAPVLSNYLQGYADFRNQSGLTSTEQEVAFLALSMTNGCLYCGAAHSMIADKMSGVPADVLAAIREGRPLPDEKLAALYKFVEELVDNKGKVNQATGEAFHKAGYTDQHVMAIVLAAAVKTLSNYTNHFFQTEVDPAFAAYKLS